MQGRKPLLILVHGGGFIENDCTSTQVRYMYEYFREHGYACASINYRLSGEATYPAAICDVKSAIRYLRANADAYGLNADHFVIWGESAGAYLATMAALSNDSEFCEVAFVGEEENPGVSASVYALAEYYGPMEFFNMDADYETLGLPLLIRKLIGTSSNGTTDAAASTDSLMGGRDLQTLFAEAGVSINTTLWDYYTAKTGEGYGLGSGSISYGDAEDFSINEVPLSELEAEDGLLESVEGTVPVYWLKRVVGEGRDMPRSMYNHTDIEEDKSKSYLELNSVELELIQYLNDNFDQVILVVNSNAALELGWLEDYPNITAVLYAPDGIAAIPRILTIEVNPSGRTVDASTIEVDIVYGADNGLTLIDLRGLDYDDPLWDDLLDQLTAEDYYNTIALSGYGVEVIESVDKPFTIDSDAANGLLYGGTGKYYHNSMTLAQTWNQELALEYSIMIGNDALLGGCNGWYAPAMNIHRTPFSGRNGEYYSEDAFLSGAVASNAIYGAATKGVYAYIKHFAFNDQENHRGDRDGQYSIATWLNEQAAREIYLVPFEMCMKVGDVELEVHRPG